jgi:small multidrug resistance pump
MSYVFLAVACISEVIVTSFLKQADGFTRVVPTLIVVIGSVVTFYSMSLAMLTIPVGVAYAIWSGVGIVLVAAVAWVVQKQKLNAGALAGMALIICGVTAMNLFSGINEH